MPKKEDIQTSEVKIEVDAWQCAKGPERSKANYDENQIIRHDGCRDSSSDSSESYNKRRRAVILKRAEQNERHAQRIERHVQRVEERGEREERMLQLCVIAIIFLGLQRQLKSRGRMRLHIKVIIITAAVMQNVFRIQAQDRPHINDEEGGTFEGLIHLFHQDALKGQPDGLKRMLRISSRN